MSNLTDTLISVIIIAGLVGGAIGFLFFGPSINVSRQQQWRSSLLSSYLTVIGFFPLFLTWTIIDLPDFEFKTILKSILLLLVYCLIGGYIFAMLNYARILMLEQYSKELQNLADRLKK